MIATTTKRLLATTLFAALLGIVLTNPVSVAAEEETDGQIIAQKADAARRAKSEHQVMTMTLQNSRGQTRVRTIESWEREVTDEEEQRFSRFLKPADVKDTTLLTYDYDDNDDDIWLFLPALKKVKRILSSNKSDYFMGSDFTYEDMENLDLKNWTFTLTGTETIDGINCYMLEARPNNEREAAETAYSKINYSVGKEDFLFRRVDFYDKKDRHSKRLTSADIRPTTETDPRPRPYTLVMANYLTKHNTELKMREIQLDVAVDDDIFSQRNMRR